jgi:hypothetical protein
MFLYARWLAAIPGAELSKPAGNGPRGSYKPSNAERVAAATKFAHRRVDHERVTLLERRGEFRDYHAKLLADAAFHAKELANQDIVENFEIRRAGLRKAAGRKVREDGSVVYEVEDAKAIEHYTRPFLELAFPKKKDGDAPVAKYTINLFGVPAEHKRLLLSGVTEPEELDEVEYEVIESEKITEGDDD